MKFRKVLFFVIIIFSAISVSPGGSSAGTPAGDIIIVPVPVVLPADGNSVSIISIGPVLDAQGAPVSGVFITITASIGVILGQDEDPSSSGIQRITDNSGMITFQFRSSQTSGTALIQASSGSAYGSGTVEIIPGDPTGTIYLFINPAEIPADGSSTALVTGGPVFDTWQHVISSTFITVSTSMGSIFEDADPNYPGKQVLTDSQGMFSFMIQAPTTSGISTVSAYSTLGDASGSSSLVFTGTCGNGIIEPGEECDDHNIIAGDGCSPSCQIECIDFDRDGFTGCNGDCNEGDPDINPNTKWYPDDDQDGFGNPSIYYTQCNSPYWSYYVLDNTDCDDTDPWIYPGGPPARTTLAELTYFQGLQEAYDSASSGDVIQLKGIVHSGNLVFGMDKSVTLENGYDCSFTHIIGIVSVSGNVYVNGGSVVIGNGSFEVQ